MPRTFEDYTPGWSLDLGSISVSEEEIIDFGRKFDPQPFHIDPVAARSGPFGGVVASGWHTCGLIMRLLVEHLLLDSDALGSPGVDTVRFLKPVRPGDTLHARCSVVDAVPLPSRPGRPQRGMVTVHVEAHNQHGELAFSMNALVLMRRRD